MDPLQQPTNGTMPPMPQPPRQGMPTWAIVLLVCLGIGAVIIVSAILIVMFIFAASRSSTQKTTNTTTTQSHESRTISADQAVTVAGNTVTTACFTFTMPAGYELGPNSKGCATSINIAGGDSLTLVRIYASSDSGTTAQELLNGTLSRSSSGVSNSGVQSIGGRDVAMIEVKDSAKLEYRGYIMPVSSSAPTYTIDGKKITSITVMGYAYNSTLVKNLEGIIASIKQD